MAHGGDVRVPHVVSASVAAVLAQAGRPFTIDHDLANRLGLHLHEGLSEVLMDSSLANEAAWYALISPDGIVGQYNRDSWGVEVKDESPGEKQEDRGGNAHEEWPTTADEQIKDAESCRTRGCLELRWVPLAGQSIEAARNSTPPRHVVTHDMNLDEALNLWNGDYTGAASLLNLFPQRYVYLRGSLSASSTLECLRGSIFQELLLTSSFGSEHFSVSMYVSQKGLQTNLHVDQHSGFLVQLQGHKRVVLFNGRGRQAAAKVLRCRGWGDAAAPVNRRSWFDDGVPDEPGWPSLPPFVGLDGCEVEVGPGLALYIPKGYFHDVLSREQTTFGFVLRCHDC
eukprot:TRINITY_DN6512_c0_g2_i1.p1 TRINITY_DN6512_c0_g2~~TRINITY_DN6512_c0_g2_i1.p1  ORF type:complete len:340 (-),score=35.24 TRINITY_DN6512_c0_g2_i1:52-1071(-)